MEDCFHFKSGVVARVARLSELDWKKPEPGDFINWAAAREIIMWPGSPHPQEEDEIAKTVRIATDKTLGNPLDLDKEHPLNLMVYVATTPSGKDIE